MDTPFELWNTRRIPTFNMGTERREAWNGCLMAVKKAIDKIVDSKGDWFDPDIEQALEELQVLYIRYDLRNTRIHPAGYWRTD